MRSGVPACGTEATAKAAQLRRDWMQTSGGARQPLLRFTQIESPAVWHSHTNTLMHLTMIHSPRKKCQVPITTTTLVVTVWCQGCLHHRKPRVPALFEWYLLMFSCRSVQSMQKVMGQHVRSRAAWMGDTKAIREYLSGGGCPNAPDARGRTPLVFAAGYGRAAAAQLLLSAGACTAASADGTTPLHR